MRNFPLTIIGVALVALVTAVVWPWVEAYRGDQSMHYHYGLIDGRQIECVAVDDTHFDRYLCLVFDSSANARVSHDDGRILLDGRPIQFPSRQNVCFLHNQMGRFGLQRWQRKTSRTPYQATARFIISLAGYRSKSISLSAFRKMSSCNRDCSI